MNKPSHQAENGVEESCDGTEDSKGKADCDEEGDEDEGMRDTEMLDLGVRMAISNLGMMQASLRCAVAVVGL